MTAGARIRVLIVDDSAFARKVLRLSLGADPRLEVIGTAGDGLDALEKIDSLKPDVVTLDLVMPNLDGVGVMRALSEASGRSPAVVLVTISDEESELVVEALQLGAVSMVKKPTALATNQLYEMSAELIAGVVAAAEARPQHVPSTPVQLVRLQEPVTTQVVVIGASTGGPQALTQLVSRLPRTLPVPVVIALHIPREYTEALAKRLSTLGGLEVIEASDGAPLLPGQALLARGGAHLTLQRDGQGLTARVSTQPASMPYFPSIDLLFSSAAQACGSNVLGAVLTGMGDDGLEGTRSIVSAGGEVLTESESSCVVYGMPRAVKEAGLSAGEARIEAMADEIAKRLQEHGRVRP